MTTANCANCGAPVDDIFCPHCGQNRRNYQRAFPPMLWELLREAFDLDSRVLRSLAALLFKPGELALEFSKNRRASYVSPLRLYLFISLVFFFLLSTTTDFERGIQIGEPANGTPEEAVVPEDLSAPNGAATSTESMDALLEILPRHQQAYVLEVMGHADTALDKQIVQGIAAGVADQAEPITEVWRFLVSQAIRTVEKPSEVARALLDNSPIAMFLLLPVFALILKLLYFSNHKFYVEHLVFATHLHSFTFIIYTILLLLPDNVDSVSGQSVIDTVGSGLILAIFLYHVTALKRYYHGSIFGTLTKFVIQMTLYFVVLMPTALFGLVVLTVLTV